MLQQPFGEAEVPDVARVAVADDHFGATREDRLDQARNVGPGAGPLMTNAMQHSQLSPEMGEEDQPRQPPRVPAWMNNAKSMGESQAQTLKTVGELVDENPKQAALIVRDWLASARSWWKDMGGRNRASGKDADAPAAVER